MYNLNLICSVGNLTSLYIFILYSKSHQSLSIYAIFQVSPVSIYLCSIPSITSLYLSMLYSKFHQSPSIYALFQVSLVSTYPCSIPSFTSLYLSGWYSPLFHIYLYLLGRQPDSPGSLPTARTLSSHWEETLSIGHKSNNLLGTNIIYWAQFS